MKISGLTESGWHTIGYAKFSEEGKKDPYKSCDDLIEMIYTYKGTMNLKLESDANHNIAPVFFNTEKFHAIMASVYKKRSIMRSW